MTLYVKRLISSVQDGVDVELGPKTIIIGKNGSGKSKHIRALELALIAKASDIAGRELVSKGIDLLQLVDEGDLTSQAFLSDGSVSKFELKRVVTGKGKKQKTSSSEGELSRPPSVDPATVLPLFALREAVVGAPATARKFFLGHTARGVTRTDIISHIPEPLHELYADALHQSGVKASELEIDKLLSALEFASKRAREAGSEAKGADAVTKDSGQGLPPPPTATDYTAAQEGVKHAEMALEQAIAGYQQQTQRASLEARVVENRAKLTASQQRLVSAQTQLAYIESEGAKLPTVESARAAVTPMNPGQRAVIDAIQWHAAQPAAPDCKCCGSQVAPGTFEPRAVAGVQMLQQHAESQAKAQRMLDWAIEQHQKLDDYLTKARFEVQQAQSKIDGDSQTIAQLEAELGAAPVSALAVTIETAREAKVAADARLKAMDDAKAAWAATQKARSAAVTATTESNKWEQLVMACTAVVAELLDGGVAAFVARVQLYLPPTDRFGLRLRDGAREVCQFGLYRGDRLHPALSGAEWARTMAAIAAVTGPTSPDKLAVVCPEDRAFDPETLAEVLTAFSKIPQQVIICSPVAPVAIPRDWTVIPTGPLMGYTPKTTPSLPAPSQIPFPGVPAPSDPLLK